MTETQSTLPDEVLLIIVDKLAERVYDPRCRSALATCLIVCKAFYDRAYHHLYSKIRLDFVNGGHHRLSRFGQALRDGLSFDRVNTLSRAIRSLEIVSLYERDSQDRVDPSWTQAVIKILDTVGDQLEVISLQAIVHVTIQWTLLGPEFTRALSKAAHSPALKSIRLVGFTHIPPSILFRASNLRHVEMRLCSVLEASNEPEHVLEGADASLFIQPEVIHTDNLKTVMNIMKPRNAHALGAEGRPARRFSRLHKAVAAGLSTTDQVNQFAQMLLFGRATLQHIHVVLEHQFTGLPTFPISSFTNLQTFKITNKETFANSFNTQRTPPEVCRAMLDIIVDESNPLSQSFEEIELEMDVWSVDARLKPFSGNETDWIRLARLLGQEKFRSIKVLKLTLTLRADETERRPSILEIDHNRRIIQAFRDIFTGRSTEGGRKVVVQIRHFVNDW